MRHVSHTFAFSPLKYTLMRKILPFVIAGVFVAFAGCNQGQLQGKLEDIESKVAVVEELQSKVESLENRLSELEAKINELQEMKAEESESKGGKKATGGTYKPKPKVAPKPGKVK